MAQHFSIRVPWKDNGYSGLVCKKPCFNTACMRLKNIADNKNDAFEEGLAGCPIKGHEEEIPCLSEGGCFMSPEEYTSMKIHPYKKGNPKTHGHFLETVLKYPPYSFPARPFGWTMRKKDAYDTFGKKITIKELCESKGINYDPDLEPNLGWDTNWVQEATNQREIFKTFYQDIEFNKSLVIAYAKQVPFVEESKRVVIGIGFITDKLDPPEYNHTNDNKFRSILWETMLSHSIRDDRENGFLLPYIEMMKYADTHPEFDINSIAVLVDDEYFNEFSYATEQVSYDAVISILNKTIKVLRIIKECGVKGNWTDCIKWCKQRLREAWLDRGGFPGFGSMLCAFGFPHGNLIAREVKNKIDDISDFENTVYKIFATPKEYFSKKIVKDITATLTESLENLPPKRKALFWLLSRLNLTVEQSKVIFDENERNKNGIDCSDEEIIENPYILYEKTRTCKRCFQISINKIDMAIFPSEIISDKYPVPSPSCLDSADDKRRIRALAVSVLETQAENGHTVYPQSKLAQDIATLPFDDDKKCEINGDVLNSLKYFFKDEIECIECADNTNAFQLNRLFKIDETIRKFVHDRLENERFKIDEDWEAIVNEAFDRTTKKIDEKERTAREEKTAILQELAESSFSVLIGGAGTGKTTILSLLCKSKQIHDGGVLLLTPTGKARVRISETMNEYGIAHKALTVAQFLIRNDRFDWNTMRYKMSSNNVKDIPFTVIIDESSMLTEEMVGAILDALKTAKRVIFVGDPNQLPPIGAGRPFVDLVRFLNHDLPPLPEPQVRKGFGKLTITRRQIENRNEVREDSKLAQCFMENDKALDADIFANLQNDSLGKHVSFKRWSTPEELRDRIFETLCEETDMNGVDDVEGFDISLGGKIENGWMNFGKKPEAIDSWQILSAYKSDTFFGTSTINRYLHEKYRTKKSVSLPNCKKRGTRHPLGTEGIVFGDKVINLRNQDRNKESEKDHILKGYPQDDELLNYIANGEVGIVERIWEKEKKAEKNTHQIRFNSQPKYCYNWYSSVSDEGNCDIELAYALTVHKAQGSEFGTVILVLSEPNRMLSRELLYTALTRQKDKIVILYNEEAYKLKKYTSVEFSDIAKRFTCLFEKPKIIEYKSKFYEEKLIHKTVRGELVRSKSEVVIANMLASNDIDYEYEKELRLSDTEKRIPDFTIFKGGKEIYWEHLGLLQNEDYAKNWDEKRKQYEKYDIIEGENLIVSKDGLDGSLDSEKIQRLIDKYLK